MARARWNGELVTAGPWLAEINAMATDLSGITPLRAAGKRKKPDRPGPAWGQPSPVPRPVSLAEQAALVRRPGPMTGLASGAGVMESRRSAYDMVLADVRAEVARRDLNPGSDGKLIQTITASHVAAWQDDSVQGRRGDAEAFADVEDVAWRIFKDVVSFGSVLDELMARPDVEEIYGRDGELTYRLISGEIAAVPYPVSAAGNLTVVQRLLADAGEQIDSSHPRATGCGCFCPAGGGGG